MLRQQLRQGESGFMVPARRRKLLAIHEDGLRYGRYGACSMHAIMIGCVRPPVNGNAASGSGFMAYPKLTAPPDRLVGAGGR